MAQTQGGASATVSASTHRISLEADNNHAKEGGQPPTAQMIMASSEMTVESISRWQIFAMESATPLVPVLARDPIARRCDPEESIYNPDPDLVFQLVENFLQTNHIKNPIFDIDMLWSQVRRFVHAGAQCEDGVVCLVGTMHRARPLRVKSQRDALPPRLPVSTESERPEKPVHHQAFATGARAQLVLYLAEIALRRIMNDALSSQYRRDSWYYTGAKWWATSTIDPSNGYGYFEYVTEYKQKLEDWYKLLPASVSFTRDPTQPVLDGLPGILRSHYIDILDVVYYRAVVWEPVTELSPRLSLPTTHPGWTPRIMTSMRSSTLISPK
ncbi:hypothetical protein BJX66DRAFT_341075 [Aspergillus keveii]|uniref:Uncharacterized protein n=1 Tax=Aspergillus keveii TaxID=714993 RepID=A0ABR4FWD8_9EURO